MKNSDVLLFAKWPVEYLIVKQLIKNGLDTEERLVVFLKDKRNELSQPWQVRLQNAFRDIQIGAFVKFDKIPDWPLEDRVKVCGCGEKLYPRYYCSKCDNDE